MAELSPERQALLLRVVDIQEKSLNGCVEVFSGMKDASTDAHVVSVAEEVLRHLRRNADVIDALISGLTATKH